MGSLEEFTKNNRRYGKNAVASLVAGTMMASSFMMPAAAFAQTQEPEKPIEQGVDEDGAVAEEENVTPESQPEPETPLTPQTPDAEVIPDPESQPEPTPEPEPAPDTNTDGGDGGNGTPDIEAPETDIPDNNTDVDGEDQDNSEEPESEDQTTPETDGDDSQKPEKEESEDNNTQKPEGDGGVAGEPEKPANPSVDDDKTSFDSPDEQTPNSGGEGNESSNDVNTPVVSTPPAGNGNVSADSANKISNTISSVTPGYNYTQQTYTSHKYTEDMTTSSFVAAIGENARQIGQERDLYASVMIAQAILESGSGTSDLSEAPNNNLFGIKGTWYDEEGVGHKVVFNTMEDDGTGNLYQIQSAFRKYDTVADSMEDYARLLHDTEEGMGNYYRGAWKSNTESYKDACYALQGTYATDTSYASKLIGLIETYDLTRFDEKLDYEITGNILDPESEEADEDGYRELTMRDYANLQAIATSQLGTPYVWGGQTPDGFDCSGLVSYVYKEALGVDITRTTYTQQYQGTEVDFDDLRMGDLVFFVDNGDVHHVGMYLGDGYYIHAPKPGDEVRITAMEDYTPDFAKRIVNFQNVEDSE